MGEDILLAEKARRSGEAIVESAALATSARYIAKSEILRVGLTNGIRIEIPVALIEGLTSATPAERAKVEIAGIGYGLHWPELDLDLSVPGLLAGIFGTRRWMNQLRAARAGASTSAAKAEAARRNGAKGGRPRNAMP